MEGPNSAHGGIPYRILNKFIIGQRAIGTVEKNKAEERTYGIAVLCKVIRTGLSDNVTL